MGKAPRNDNDLPEKLREDIRHTENQIIENVREIEDKLSLEALSRAAAAKGSEVIGEKVQPLITGMGDTMKDIFGKALDAVNREPLPALMMGVGTGLVLMSLYSNKKETAEVQAEKIGDSGSKKSGSESLGAVSLGLSALVMGAVMSGVVPGIDSEKVEEWKSDLLAKAGEAGDAFLKSTEKMLREKFQPETP